MAFFQNNFPADDLIARRRVAFKLNAPHGKLLAFVEIDFEIDHFLRLIHFGVGQGSEVDVAQFAVSFAQGFDALADLLAVEDVAILNREQAAKRLHVRHCLAALEGNCAQVVQLAFFNRDRDVHRLSGLAVY